MCNKKGFVELIIGCMFSGKTSELFRRTCLLEVINKEYILVNHSKDTRYGNNVISTHDKHQKYCVCLESICDLWHKYADIYERCDDIFIEEAQFFEDLEKFVLVASRNKKNIYIFGLDGDFKAKMFNSIVQVLPHANKITKLNALCKSCNDGTEAIYTHLLDKSNVINESNIIIGNQEKYIPLCRECYFEKHILT